MIDKKLNLARELTDALRTCDEVWIAVALISDSGFKIIQDNINIQAIQHYLVGIGLPTSPSVLSKLKEVDGNGNFETRIYHKPEKLFHPKVYVLRTRNKFVAYVGSGNCTEGGLMKNIELTVKSDDQDFCTGIIEWFNSLYKFGKQITDELLTSYTLLFARRKIRMEEDQEELNALIPSDDYHNWIRSIDFTGQFFKLEHFIAFEGRKPWMDDDQANTERNFVRQRLFALHEKLYPRIQKLNWDLHEHYVYDDTVSSAVHNLFTSVMLNGVWLHYGRDKKTIKNLDANLTPIDFMRMQVILHKDSVGIWNRVGKDNGSKIDRAYFKNKMKTDPAYRRQFYQIITTLPPEYFIRVNNEFRYVSEFKTEDELSAYVLKDQLPYYFIIGVELAPGDKNLSSETIFDTAMEHFGRLYPTYELMKYKI